MEIAPSARRLSPPRLRAKLLKGLMEDVGEMMRVSVLAAVALVSGCAAMQPPSSGPWPPIRVAAVQAVAPAPLAGPPAPAATPAPATIEPNAAPAPGGPAALFSLPDGWRVPNDAELEGPLLIRRGDSPSLYLAATGDFNSDGRPDRALLLVSDAQNQFGVFIDDGRSATTPLLVGTPGAAVVGLGLETTSAGALRFFQFGAAQYAIGWDGATYAVTPEGD
jgi:hypothetical protein